MANSVANPAQANLGGRFAHVSPARQAKASLPEQETATQDPALFECIEATQRKFKLSDKEMSALLRISQPNYSRRKYNGARVQLLDLEQRRYFIHCYAKTVGLKADQATPTDQLKVAAKVAVVNLLDLMEALK